MKEALATWPYKLLDREVHSRLVDSIDTVAKVAGITPAAIDRSMKDYGCPDSVINWVKNFYSEKESLSGGLLIIGKHGSSGFDMLVAITAAFLRNYVDARFVRRSDVAPNSSGEYEDDPTVLVIPDFALSSDSGKDGFTITNWQAQYLNGYLMSRYAAGKKTVLYADSEKAIADEYGSSVREFLIDNWFLAKNK